MSKDDPRILLVQMRTDEMKEHEFKCFVSVTELSDENFDTLDVFCDDLDTSVIDKYDAVIVGGTGEFCVSERNMKHLEPLKEFVREVRKRAVPLFGMCYGFHVLTEALGGEIEQDKSRMETGTYMTSLTPEAENDPLLSKMPKEFMAQYGHKDHAVKLPPGAVHLAQTERSNYQAWTLPGESVYAIQFHAELDEKTIMERFEHYRPLYFPSQKEFDEYAKTVKPSPVAPKVMLHFIENIVKKGQTYPKE